MRDYGKVWVDQHGEERKVPTIVGRLKFRIPLHAALRDFVFQRDGFRCGDCGENDRDKLVMDHVVSRRNGGAHHPSNLRTLCARCNSRKSGLVDAKAGRQR